MGMRRRYGLNLVPFIPGDNSVIPAVVHRFSVQRRISDTIILCRLQQVSPGQVQLGQSTDDKKPVGVFIQSSIADLSESEYSLDQEEVFDLGAYLRFGAVPGAVFFSQVTITIAFLDSKVLGLWRMFAEHLILSAIGRIAPDAGFLSMQQVRQELAVMDIGRSGCNRMDQFCPAVYANVCHSEAPLVALLRLVHFRVPLALAVLGRTGSGDDGRIDYRTGADFKTIFLKEFRDQDEQLLTQVVHLQQMPELADRGFIRCRLTTQVDPNETTHGTRVIQSFLNRWIGEVEPVLEKIDA